MCSRGLKARPHTRRHLSQSPCTLRRKPKVQCYWKTIKSPLNLSSNPGLVTMPNKPLHTAPPPPLPPTCPPLNDNDDDIYNDRDPSTLVFLPRSERPPSPQNTNEAVPSSPLSEASTPPWPAPTRPRPLCMTVSKGVSIYFPPLNICIN